jgi:hypothetical protein
VGEAVIAGLTLALCAMINRFAGGGMIIGEWWNPADPDKLWGRALYPAIALIGIVALIWHPWPVALAFATTFGFWRSFSWGILIGLGRPSGADNRDLNPVEDTLRDLFGVHGGLFMRHMFVLPCLMLVGYLADLWWAWLAAVAFAGLATLAYELAWRLTPRHPLTTAEFAVGALWGALIIATATL